MMIEIESIAVNDFSSNILNEKHIASNIHFIVSFAFLFAQKEGSWHQLK